MPTLSLARGNVLVEGDLGLIADLCQQPLGGIRVRRGEYDGHQRPAPLGHGTGQFLEVTHLLHGDLGGGVVEERQRHIALRAVENADLGFRAQVECGHRGGIPGSNFSRPAGPTT